MACTDEEVLRARRGDLQEPRGRACGHPPVQRALRARPFVQGADDGGPQLFEEARAGETGAPAAPPRQLPGRRGVARA
eukprot:8648090-Pyramimonas_sp.AAC.1